MNDVPPTRTKYSVRYTLSVTEDMAHRLQQVLDQQDRSISLNDLLRIAIRQYLDDQEDVIGSRRHFSKSLQQRFDQMESRVIFYLNILIYLVAAGLAVIIQAATKDSRMQSVALIRTAIAATLKEGKLLNQQIQAVRDELGDSG